MELTGRIIALLPLQTGTGKNGPWKKQEYIVETGEKIARKVCFSLWGDKIDQFGPGQGDEVEVMFDLESREYNGRWYTEVKAWKVVKKGGAKMVADEEPPADIAEDGTRAGMDEVPF